MKKIFIFSLLICFPGVDVIAMKTDTLSASFPGDRNLDFFEDWGSGNFYANNWTVDGQNWSVTDQDGNPAPCAQFSSEPVQMNYEASLTSRTMDAEYITEGDLWFDYDLKLNMLQSDPTEFMHVQIWNDDIQEWVTIKWYNNADGNIPWISEHLKINAYGKGKAFRIRFRVSGDNSQKILSWCIDNIRIYRECIGPTDLILIADWPESGIWYGWEPFGGEIADWIRWDNGTNHNGFGLEGGGTFSVAARWEPFMLEGYDSTELTHIQFFMYYNAPGANVKVRVWVGSQATLVVDQTAAVLAGAWNTVVLTTPVSIDITQELWVGYETTHQADHIPAGVDSGPAIAGYGDMFYFNDSWHTLSSLGFNNNWNVAAFVRQKSEAKPKLLLPVSATGTNARVKMKGNQHYIVSPTLNMENGSRELAGCNVLRNANGGQWGFLPVCSGFDPADGLVPGTYYCYMVQVFYESAEGDYCESELSNPACVLWGVGVNDNVGNSVFSIYPNPASDHVYITSGSDLQRVTVCNTLGQTVFDQFITGNQFDLKTTDYKSGIYMIRVETGDRIFSEKVLVH